MKFSQFVSKIASFLGLNRQSDKKTLGILSEKEAAKYLSKNCGLKILARNYKHKHKEIDIVAFDKIADCLVFVEVKSRLENAQVSGYHAAMSLKKRKNILAAAKQYMREIKSEKSHNYRYDVVNVVHNKDGEVLEISHFPNVGFKSLRR